MFAGASLDENSGAFCELKANFFRLILTKAELAGLTWDNVDFKNNMLTIDKTVNRYRKKDFGFNYGVGFSEKQNISQNDSDE